MKKLLKFLGALVALLVVAIAGLFGFAYLKTESDLAKKYEITDPPLAVVSDDAALARGKHLFTVMGCAECHAEGGVGKLLFEGPPGRFAPPNITPAALRDRYSDDQLAAAIRHGVKADGTPLMFMPAGDFHQMSDADVAALVAFMRTLPPSDNDPGPTRVSPLGRVATVLGQMHLIPAADLDHAPRERTAPAVATARISRASTCRARRRISPMRATSRPTRSGRGATPISSARCGMARGPTVRSSTSSCPGAPTHLSVMKKSRRSMPT
jgi:mono/diheme cytochrome c family protein